MSDTTVTDYDGITLEGVIDAARPILEEVLASAGKPLTHDATHVMAELLRRLIAGAEHLTKFRHRLSPPWLHYEPFSNTLTIHGIRYSHGIFETFATGETHRFFRIVGREHGLVMLEQTEDYVLNAAPDMVVALNTIAGIAKASVSASSLPHIAKVARDALARLAPPDRSEPSHPQAKP